MGAAISWLCKKSMMLTSSMKRPDRITRRRPIRSTVNTSRRAEATWRYPLVSHSNVFVCLFAYYRYRLEWFAFKRYFVVESGKLNVNMIYIQESSFRFINLLVYNNNDIIMYIICIL